VDGTTGFEAVLYVMHSASNDPTPVLRISTARTAVRLLGEHFMPISVGGCHGASYRASRHTPASSVRVGDGLWVQQGAGESALICDPVVVVHGELAPGVRNPLLQGASIIVDGVAASTHTLWPGEGWLPGVWHLLPALHNALLTPIQLFGVVAFALPQGLSRCAVPALLRLFQFVESALDVVFGQPARFLQWPWLAVSAVCAFSWLAAALCLLRTAKTLVFVATKK
jgi:hypothetical protein